MHKDDQHLTDAELLMAGDGELSPHRASKVQAHLEGCEDCRNRLQQIKQATSVAAQAYRDALDGSLPPAAIARAALQSRLAAENPDRQAPLLQNLAAVFRNPAWSYVAAMLVICAALLIFHYRTSRLSSEGEFSATNDSAPLVPDASLTPGAVASVTAVQVCAADEPAEKRPPQSLARAVFHEYGMDGARAQEYEVDHLITPALGGTDDIRNLWPESYSSEWNAHVKDDLEDRLHELVCDGKIDLGTAQHDMASNWISAYKKYFHTDKPLLHNSSMVADRKNSPNS